MKRIQRKRTKGWRMPENTVYIGRGSKWGNPYKVGTPIKQLCGFDDMIKFTSTTPDQWRNNEPATAKQCIELYAGWLSS